MYWFTSPDMTCALSQHASAGSEEVADVLCSDVFKGLSSDGT